MGLIKPSLPQFSLDGWEERPHLERMKLLAQDWAAQGMGTPYAVHLLYALKIVGYVLGGMAFIAATPGFGSMWNLDMWQELWRQPIVYQKAIVWTMLFEVLGLGASSGPLAFRFLPPIQACLNWLRPGTIRLPPWGDRVPGTKGETRSALDVLLYVAILGTEVYLLLAHPVAGKSGLPDGTVGLMPPAGLAVLVVLLVVAGLRDRLLFLASRGEQYWTLCVLFLLFPYTDMIVGAKLVMCVVWWGAAFSKLGPHFTYVVPPMLSNAPLVRPAAVKKLMYRDWPENLQPSKLGWLAAHSGTVIEAIAPFALLLSPSKGFTLAVVCLVMFFHFFITSQFPLAVPLEWNVLFIFATFWLFYGHGAWEGFALWDMNPMLAVPLLVVLFLFPIWGNLRPDQISFLPSARYYAGNWATSQWAFKKGPTKHEGAEHKINTHVKTGAKTQYEQLNLLYGHEVAEIFLQKCVAWRSLHSHGRALNTLIQRHLPDVEAYDIREGEFAASTVLGWQFGDGHLHDEQLMSEMQRRCQFEPGDCIVVYIESEPFMNGEQHYRVHDLALGLIEEGYVRVSDMVATQGWLPDGPIPVRVVGSTQPEVAGSSGPTY